MCICLDTIPECDRQTDRQTERIAKTVSCSACTSCLCVIKIHIFPHFNGHFLGGPGLAGTRMSPFWILSKLSMTEVAVTTGAETSKAPVKSSPPTNQHPVFYRPDALPVAQPTVSEHWRKCNKNASIVCNSQRLISVSWNKQTVHLRSVSAIEWFRERTEKFHIYETEKITHKASDAAEYIELFGSFTRDRHARRI